MIHFKPCSDEQERILFNFEEIVALRYLELTFVTFCGSSCISTAQETQLNLNAENTIGRITAEGSARTCPPKRRQED